MPGITTHELVTWLPEGVGVGRRIAVSETALDLHHKLSGLVVLCSDGRFKNGAATAFLKSLAEEHGLERTDWLAVPGGGGALLDSAGAAYIHDQVVLLVKAHEYAGDGTVVLVTHYDCGYYAKKYPDLEPQARELLEAAESVRADFPNLQIWCVLELVNEQGLVEYRLLQ